jgi:benzoylformate decarboxylase
VPAAVGVALADRDRGVSRAVIALIDVETTPELEQEFKTALTADTTTVIVVRTQPQNAML